MTPDWFPLSDAFLAGREAHLYSTNPDDLGDHASRAPFLDMLNDDERRRYDRFHFDHSKREFLAGRALVRGALAAYVGLPPRDVPLVFGPNAKPTLGPEVPAERRVEFNLSHTRGVAAIALARVEAVGLDVETIEPPRAEAGLAERYFSPGEVEFISALTAARKVALFHRIWTLKEAYVKARGLGLTLPLKHFTFGFAGPGLARVTIEFSPDLPDDPAAWQFDEFSPDPDHAMSLALRRPPDAPVEVLPRAIVLAYPD